MASEKRDVTNFSKIELLAAGEIHIEQADEYSLNIEAEDHVLERLTAIVNGDTLLLDVEDGKNINTKESVRYFIKLPKLEVVRVSGGGKLIAETISGASLLIDVPGALNFTIETIKVNAFRLDVRGAINGHINKLVAQGIGFDVKGTLKLSLPSLKAEAVTSSIEGTANLELGGEAGAQIIHAPGVINYQAGNLQSTQVTLNAKGMANVTLWVEKHLNLRLEGVGNVKYYGNPERQVKINGMGNVKRLGDKPQIVSHV